MVALIPMGSFWTLLLCTAFLSLWATPSQGLDISYCSPDNNAGSYQGHYNEFQSNGACQQQCQGSFAFAVLQGYYCWCSNYVPTPQESTYNCNQQCPGFNSDWCGNTDSGLYGYYLLSAGVPLGTSGSTPSTPSSTPSPSSSSVSIDTSTVTSNSLSASSPSLDTGSPTSPPASDTWRTSRSSSVVTYGSSQSSSVAGVVTWSSDTSMSFMSPTTPLPASTTTPPPSSSPSPTSAGTAVYTSITTVTGEVRTVVVTPSAAATSDATLGQSSTGGGGVSTGKVVGIVLGVALGIGGLIGTAVYLWFRQRHKKLQQEHGPETAYLPRTGDSSPSNNVPSRQVSQLSSSGLLGTKIPRINTSGVTLGTDLRSADSGSSAFDRRSVGTDQRLNPYALYIHDESRLSNVSLQDNQDYSRQLRVANPDP